MPRSINISCLAARGRRAYRGGVSFRVFVEVFEWSIKIFSHRDQPFCAAELRRWLHSGDWHEPDDMLIVFGNANFVTTNRRFNQIGQRRLGLFNAYLMHAGLPQG